MVTGAMSIQASVPDPYNWDNDSAEFFSGSSENDEENLSTPNGPHTPNNPETDRSTSEQGSTFLQRLPQKTYSFLWKDASCVQRVSELIIAGACIGAIAYKYNESFRKRVQTLYKKLRNDTTSSEHQEEISVSNIGISNPIPRLDISPKEEEQPLNSINTNDHLSLDIDPLILESV